MKGIVRVSQSMDSSGRKKPNPDFVVRLVGPGLHPWEVPMRSLAQILQATQRLVDERDEDIEDEFTADEPETIEPDEPEVDRVLRLVDVKDGSAIYGVAAPEKARLVALALLMAMGRAIESPDRFDWPQSTLSTVRELSEVARRLKCDVELREPSNGRHLGELLATVKPETFKLVQGTAFVRGKSSVFGTIQRVGGATKTHCGLYLPDRSRLLICRVANADLARQLGQYLYQGVVLAGEATWLRHNWQLRTMNITSFEPPKTGSIRDALRAIHQAGGYGWDRIEDPDAVIAEMRGN